MYDYARGALLIIKYDSACFSKGKINWGTPPELYAELNKEFGPFRLDPCTVSWNPLNTPVYYTKEHDGLSLGWLNPTFCNPPYGRDIIKWVHKASYECSWRDNLVVMLLPSRTDTFWFHRYLYREPRVEIRFLRGRQKMIDLDNPDKKPNTAPFPSLVAIFKPVVTTTTP